MPLQNLDASYRQRDNDTRGECFVSIHPSGYATEFIYYPPPKGKGGRNEYTNSRSRKARFFDVITALNYQKRIDSFWTFTIPYKQTDFKNTDTYYTDLFSKLLENLRVRHKRKRPNGLENYVWVAEAQKRGTIHFHLVSTSFLRIDYVRKQWNKLLECDTNNLQSVHVQRVTQTEIRNIAHYFAKYMSKAMDKGEHKTDEGLKNRILYCKSFGYTKNFEIPKQICMPKSDFERIKTDLILPKTEKTYFDKETGEIVTYELNPTQTKTIQNENGQNIDITTHYLYTQKAFELCISSRELQ